MDALPGVKWAASSCKRYRIYVSNIGAFVVPRVKLSVSPGEKVAGFGSGGFKAPAELEVLGIVAKPVVPVLDQGHR